ncbi:hypothetical protein [Achromobacter sp. DH1f]|uniref:hypothetical protein n=1 Tax=Achromobacter sp. DH1f TaxID=1397275 RepID=UPI00046A0096|nr:hypothetical protein [Achromobacter sp. DH1f]
MEPIFVMTALSKQRAPVSDIREGFELTYAANADDPACASDLGHFTNGWQACIMAQVGKPVVMKLEVDATAAIARINDEVARLRAPVADERAAFEYHARACELTRDENEPDEYRNSHVQEYWNGWKARAALASAPVAGWSLRGPSAGSWRGEFSRRVYENLAAADNQDVPLEEYPARILAVLDAMGAPVAGEAQRVFLVPTGEVYCGQETYTRHEGQPPVNTDNECLYAAPQASEAVRKLPKGWHYALNVAIDALEHETPTGEGWPDNWPAIVQDLNGLRDALTQPPADKDGAACACPSGDGSLRPCAVHPPVGAGDTPAYGRGE